jgi:transposase InsO family protein
VTIKERLRALLSEFRSVFSVNENDLGRTVLLSHGIDTGDAAPVRQQLRRHPPAHQEALRQQISTMLEQKIIEPAQSAWASNVVLVRKKDNSLRCCIDYRQLNAVTRKVAYPLPRTDMCFDAMSGAKWFSTFDLRSSYHQVPLDPADADKTSFICRQGMFRFKTMPFGLCNAGATFQRLMDIVLSGLSFDICLAYLDDIIVFSEDESSHVNRLRVVLSRLQQAGLKLKPSKCSLMQRSVLFLGHVISACGIATDPQKTHDIVNWPVPQNIKEVRAFLGLCGYYRRYVERFAELARPLHALTEKNHRFEWTTQCQTAFDSLKTALTSPPILAVPNDSDQFILDTDASNWAIGAVLSQIQGGGEKVIAYASRKLSRSEANYCVTRRELLAIVYFVKYFRHYLLGRPIVIRTDHAALQWLRRTPEVVGQQARWIATLEEYDYVVQHRPGARHANADAMSRLPCLRTQCCGDGVNRIEVGQISIENPDVIEEHSQEFDILRAQDEDIEIAMVKKTLQSSAEPPQFDDIAGTSSLVKALYRQFHRLSADDGILRRTFEEPSTGCSIKQVVWPRRYRRSLIQEIHHSLGHLGQTRTKAAVQQRAYWPGWSSDVEGVLRECEACARYKRGSAPKQTHLRPFLSGEPFETVSIDITGPHPRSRNGFMYILTVQDHFTKWAEAIPIRNHTATIVADALFKNVFMRYGMPMRLLSDQGAEFESKLFQQLCEMASIAKIRTTPYRPSTNGMIERFHRTLNSMLAKVINDDQRNWDEKLPSVMMAYRASVHESTGFTPNRLMFGREVRLPVDLVYPTPVTDGQNRGLENYVRDLQETTADVFDVVRQKLGSAAQSREDRYNCKTKSSPNFQQGDRVWYFYPRRIRGKSAKWQKWYTGPYTVMKVIDSHNLVIRRNAKAKLIVVHRDKLKHCHEPVPQSIPTACVASTPRPANLDSLPPEKLNSNHRPRRENRQRPGYLQHYVCSVSGASMASKTVQITSGTPYCFLCNIMFSKDANLKRHNVNFRQRHDEIRAQRDLMSLGSACETAAQQPFPSGSHSRQPDVRTVGAIYTTPPCGPEHVSRRDPDRVLAISAEVLEYSSASSVAEIVQHLIEGEVQPTLAGVITRATLAGARHAANLHAVYTQLRQSEVSDWRTERLQALEKELVRYSLGLPEHPRAEQSGSSTSGRSIPSRPQLELGASDAEPAPSLRSELSCGEEMSQLPPDSPDVSLEARLPDARLQLGIIDEEEGTDPTAFVAAGQESAPVPRPRERTGYEAHMAAVNRIKDYRSRGLTVKTSNNVGKNISAPKTSLHEDSRCKRMTPVKEPRSPTRDGIKTGGHPQKRLKTNDSPRPDQPHSVDCSVVVEPLPFQESTQTGSKVKTSIGSRGSKTPKTDHLFGDQSRTSLPLLKRLDSINEGAERMETQGADRAAPTVFSGLVSTLAPAAADWPIMDVAPAPDFPTICRATDVPVRSNDRGNNSRQERAEKSPHASRVSSPSRRSGSSSSRKGLARHSPERGQRLLGDAQQRDVSRSQSRRPTMRTTIRRYPFYSGRWARMSSAHRNN